MINGLNDHNAIPEMFNRLKSGSSTKKHVVMQNNDH